jgi:hypothetical protein
VADPAFGFESRQGKSVERPCEVLGGGQTTIRRAELVIEGTSLTAANNLAFVALWNLLASNSSTKTLRSRRKAGEVGPSDKVSPPGNTLAAHFAGRRAIWIARDFKSCWP